MQQSSSIASLAAALAKAQGELVNPEKSLVATIRADPTGAERSFRYAPLSSGLDIVRKTLGQHEIATVQTTAIDQSAGIVNLTTVLAHSSGEWIASDWPVCAISETARPHRMGAALTYARRYALFTLVGIAGEDDLDAPDLVTPTQKSSGPRTPSGNPNSRLNGSQGRLAPQTSTGRGTKTVARPTKAMIGAEASVVLRDQLVAELAAIASSEDAAIWAHRRLSAKNILTAADARQVEDTFQAKLASFGNAADIGLAPVVSALQPSSSDEQHPVEVIGTSIANGIDKSLLAHPEPRRVRDKDHVRFVGGQPCLICDRRPADAHHLRFAQSRALGRKVSDEFTVPLCRGHHREVHRCGDEAAWWTKAGIDPTVSARALWLTTHPLPATSGKEDNEGATSLTAIRTEKSNAQRDRRVSKRGRNSKTKPFVADGPQ